LAELTFSDLCWINWMWQEFQLVNTVVGIVPTYYADHQPGAFWITDLCSAFWSASNSVISLDYRPRKFKLEFQPFPVSETGLLFYEPSILVVCKFSILLPNPYIYEFCWDFFLPSCTWFKGQIINSRLDSTLKSLILVHNHPPSFT